MNLLSSYLSRKASQLIFFVPLRRISMDGEQEVVVSLKLLSLVFSQSSSTKYLAGHDIVPHLPKVWKLG